MKYCIVDERLPADCESALLAQGVKIIKLAPLRTVAGAVSSHTDIILFRHGGNIICPKRYLCENPDTARQIYSLSSFINIKESPECPEGAYPHDAVFNALVIGKYLFAKCDSVCRDILDYADSAGLTVINVKQGYPACTVLAVGDDAAITSDLGMARILDKLGIDTLTVSEDASVLLPPYKNGFIGGCGGALGDDIYFAGNLFSHKDGQRIADFIESHGKRVKSLASEASWLCDLGGLFFYENNT